MNFAVLLVLGCGLGTGAAQAGDLFYQAGSRWDKHVFGEAEMAVASPAFKKAAMALGKMQGGGSAFYLGKHNGVHIAATNWHVAPQGCQDDKINFEYLKKKFVCGRQVGVWPELEISFFALRVPVEDEAQILPHALKMDFTTPVSAGRNLISIGYGHHNNPASRSAADQGPDCRVISKTNDFRPKADIEYPNSPGVWSFAMGCEASQGDSGSAVVDRETGKVVGILWYTTQGHIVDGKYRQDGKNPRVQNTAYLESLIQDSSSAAADHDVWSELNYAGAIPKVLEIVSRELANPASRWDAWQRATLKALLEAQK